MRKHVVPSRVRSVDQRRHTLPPPATDTLPRGILQCGWSADETYDHTHFRFLTCLLKNRTLFAPCQETSLRRPAARVSGHLWRARRQRNAGGGSRTEGWRGERQAGRESPNRVV